MAAQKLGQSSSPCSHLVVERAQVPLQLLLRGVLVRQELLLLLQLPERVAVQRSGACLAQVYQAPLQLQQT